VLWYTERARKQKIKLQNTTRKKNQPTNHTKDKMISPEDQSLRLRIIKIQNSYLKLLNFHFKFAKSQSKEMKTGIVKVFRRGQLKQLRVLGVGD